MSAFKLVRAACPRKVRQVGATFQSSMSGNALSGVEIQLREKLYFSKLYLQMETRTRLVRSLYQIDLAGYAVSAILASLIYVVWLSVSIAFGEAGTTHPGLLFGFGFAFVFSFVGGFGLALLLMIVPWAIVVWVHLKTRWDGRIYYPAVGALLLFTLGCTTSAMSPRPFFVEDQTFLEGAVITAQRQGLCLLFCGIAFGACYWWLERRIRAEV